jgi:hypothetical protein
MTLAKGNILHQMSIVSHTGHKFARTDMSNVTKFRNMKDKWPLDAYAKFNQNSSIGSNVMRDGGRAAQIMLPCPSLEKKVA